jgi:hypothetical protein
MFHALVELRGCMSRRLRTFRAGITAEQAMVIVINLGPSALAGRHCATVFARWVRYAKSNIDLTLGNDLAELILFRSNLKLSRAVASYGRQCVVPPP